MCTIAGQGRMLQRVPARMLLLQHGRARLLCNDGRRKDDVCLDLLPQAGNPREFRLCRLHANVVITRVKHVTFEQRDIHHLPRTAALVLFCSVVWAAKAKRAASMIMTTTFSGLCLFETKFNILIHFFRDALKCLHTQLFDDAW